MRSGQLEGSQVVIEGGGFPGGCVVAGAANGAEATLMVIIFKVTANTGHRRVLVLVGGGVTARTQQRGMFSVQLEYVKVIEGGRLPGGRGMTAFAGCAFCALMHISQCMAAHTGQRRTLEFAVDMA